MYAQGWLNNGLSVMFLMVANGCDSDPTVPGLNLSELSENSKLYLAIPPVAFELPAL